MSNNSQPEKMDGWVVISFAHTNREVHKGEAAIQRGKEIVHPGKTEGETKRDI